MAIKQYSFVMSGTAAQGQSWATQGQVECEWHDIMDNVMRVTFMQLTNGKATYGNPGVGCIGPYNIDTVTISQERPQ